MRLPTCLDEAFCGPFSPSPAGSYWKNFGWRRTNWCLRRELSSSLTSPSKARSSLLGFCPKFMSLLLSPFFQEGFLDWSLFSLHGPSGIWVSTWQICPWPRSYLLVCASLGMAGTWPKLTLPPFNSLIDRLLLIVSYGHLDTASEPLLPQCSGKSEFTFEVKPLPISVLVLSLYVCLCCATSSSRLNLGTSLWEQGVARLGHSRTI